jgi:hypothetical protein
MTTEKTFEEVLAYAQTLHPDATVKSTDENTWQVIIPTDFTIPYGLPESYKGTPAWEAYEEQSSGGESVLERWGRKNSHGWSPTVIVADYYNLLCEKLEWVHERVVADVVAAGFPDNAEAILAIEDEERKSEGCRIWMRLEKEYKAQAEIHFLDKLTVIQKRDV